MKISDEKAFELLKDDRDALEEENRLLKNRVHYYVNKLFEADSLISKMKNCSWIGVSISLVISFAFSILAFHSLSDSYDTNELIGVTAGVWWCSLFTYYIFWRLEFK